MRNKDNLGNKNKFISLIRKSRFFAQKWQKQGIFLKDCELCSRALKEVDYKQKQTVRAVCRHNMV